MYTFTPREQRVSSINSLTTLQTPPACPHPRRGMCTDARRSAATTASRSRHVFKCEYLIRALGDGP